MKALAVTTIAIPDTFYQSVNEAVLAQVPREIREVLDVGCGSGVFGSALKARNGAALLRVTGLTLSQTEADSAKHHLDEVIVVDLNSLKAELVGLRRYDCIVCSHVLEHVIDPAAVLTELQRGLKPGGFMVVALPNVLFWRQRLQFLLGRFRYADGGLMDRTHLRFFDWKSATELLERVNLRVIERRADGGMPLSRWLGQRLSERIDQSALTRFPGLFGAQFVLLAKARPETGG
jgi:SAM-dependent methyltransferase